LSLDAEGHALLLKRIDYRDADLIVTLFTYDYGKVQALARGARRSRKRFAGSLEPMHTLKVELTEPGRGQLYELRSASVATPRVQLTQRLERLEAAGRVLGWLRHALPEKSRDPQLWALAIELMDTLDATSSVDCPATLSQFGLRLLMALGWGIDFDHCVKCGSHCPPNRSATVSATQGGLICSSCGGAKTKLPGLLRARLSNAASGQHGLAAEDAGLALRLVEEALGAHADML